MNEYPNLWKRGEIQKRVRARANHCCEQCGMEFREGTNIAVSAVNRLGNPIIGTVHHINEDKADCSMKNLIYLCQICHFSIHRWNWHPGEPLPKKWLNNPPGWIVKRGIPYRLNPNVFNAPHLYEAQLF